MSDFDFRIISAFILDFLILSTAFKKKKRKKNNFW